MDALVRLKPGVTIRGLQPEMAFGHSIVASVFIAHGYDCIVTSGTERAGHSYASLHWSGCALDYRTKHIRDQAMLRQVAVIARECLGKDFDVILESEGKDNEHLHVEYQPKRVG